MKYDIKHKSQLVDKLFEVDKTYTTKMQTGEKFTIHKIDVSKSTGKQTMAWGIYETCPHLTNCPIHLDRLIPEQEEIKIDVEFCSNCGKEK